MTDKRKIPFSSPIQRPEDTDFVNGIVYGDTGSGKTYLLGTAIEYDETFPFLLIDVEGGTKTLRGKKVDVVRPASWKELQEIYNFFRHDNHKYKALGIDSLTELQKKYSLGHILGDLREEEDYTNLADTIVPTRQDWLKTGDQMRKFIRAFKGLSYLRGGNDSGDPIHVFMTCLEKIDEKKNIIGPMFSGQLALESGAYVDVLARLSAISVEEDDGDGNPIIVTKRHLLIDAYVTEEGVRYLAKNRGSSRRQIWNPTIEEIVKIGRERKEGSQEEATE